jgi:hypothetical protein
MNQSAEIAKIIDRESVEFQLMTRERNRFERAFPYMSQEEKEEKVAQYKSMIRLMSRRKLNKHYADTFGGLTLTEREVAVFKNNMFIPE